MITLEVIHALLLGLPSKRLEHLDRTPWGVLCWRIEHNLKNGKEPLAALKQALEDAHEGERSVLRQALAQVLPVMSLPGLTYRQKQALIALRYAKSASLTQLSHTLMADRSNTHRRLQALVRRGLAIKFSQPRGIYYMAVSAPLSKEIKLGIQRILDQLLDELQTEATKSTTPTTATTPT